MQPLKFIEKNGEKILAFTLYGDNRSQEVTQWHKKVMVDHFGLNINYIQCPFPGVSHGQMMNYILSQTVDSIKPDYFWFIDNDLIILKKECVDIFYNLVKDKIGIASHVQNSNHKKNRVSNSVIHPYASQAFLLFPTEIYNNLNRPCMDHWSEETNEYGGDTAERFTLEAKRAGYIVSLIYPSHVVYPHSPLDANLVFGMGNSFRDLIFHAMRADLPESKDIFINKCKEILKFN